MTTTPLSHMIQTFIHAPQISYFKSYAEQTHPSRIIAGSPTDTYTHVASGCGLCATLLRYLCVDTSQQSETFPGVGEIHVLKNRPEKSWS
jgi:hypothetical protein